MLWPKRSRGRSVHGRRTGVIRSASSAMLVAHGSVRRSWRPGYCTASTSTDAGMPADTGR